MKPFMVPAGSQVFLGAPAKPMPPARAAAIGGAVDSIGGIAEAHLPQCFVPGVMVTPTQVLVLVLEDKANPTQVLDEIGRRLADVLSTAENIDVWPMSSQSALLADVRSANCGIGKGASFQPAATKAWWKFWR
jgi:hypothetical protein